MSRQLPLDIDEDETDAEVFLHTVQRNAPPSIPTSLSCYIHLLRLKRIESMIQHTMYRVDCPPLSDTSHQTDKYLELLSEWKHGIPAQSVDRAESTFHQGSYFHAIDIYVSLSCSNCPSIVRVSLTLLLQMIAYHSSVRLLLQPQLYKKSINPRYLQLCTQACSGVCETFRRVHDSMPVAFSTLSLQTVFLAGNLIPSCSFQNPTL